MKEITKIKTYGIATLLAVFLFGCDDAEKSIKNLSEQPEMQGTFLSSCEKVGVDGMGSVSIQDELRLEGNQVRINSIYYSDSDCNSESEIGRVEYEGEFEVDRQGLERIAENYEEINEEQKKNLDAGVVSLEVDEAKVKATDQTLVSLFNGISFCGQDDYQVDQEKKINQAATDEFFCPLKELPANMRGGYIYNEESRELTFSEYKTDEQIAEAEQRQQEEEQAGPLVGRPSQLGGIPGVPQFNLPDTEQEEERVTYVTEDGTNIYPILDAFRSTYKKQ